MNAKNPEIAEHSSSTYKLERFQDRLETLANEMGGWNALARAAGVSQGGMSRYKSGGEPTRPILVALADAAEVNIEWLAAGRGPRKLSEEEPTGFEADFALVSIYNVLLSAGPGAFPDNEQAIGNLAFTRYWLRTRGLHNHHLVATNAKGDSMEPTIRDGDMLLIDTQQRELGQDDIYAIRRDDLLMVKRLQLQFDQNILIISDNPLYEKQSIPTADLDIIGRVVWIGHTL